MADLTTLARVSELLPNFSSADNSVLQDILTSCSALIERYCNRTFASTTYDEVYDGQGTFNLLLDNFPVTSIDRVNYIPVQVVMIRNIDSGVSRANFRLTGTTTNPPRPNTLVLTSVKNGTTTTHTIQIDGNGAILTYGDLATAINAFSSDGWSASALGTFSTWAVSEVRPPQGGYECRWAGSAYLYQHAWSFGAFAQRPEIGEIVSTECFVRGYQNYRVIYTAGYSTVPTDIQQACAELSAGVYLARNVNPNLQSQNLGGYSYSALAERQWKNLSVAASTAIEQYRNRRIVRFKAW